MYYLCSVAVFAVALGFVLGVRVVWITAPVLVLPAIAPTVRSRGGGDRG